MFYRVTVSIYFIFLTLNGMVRHLYSAVTFLIFSYKSGLCIGLCVVRLSACARFSSRKYSSNVLKSICVIHVY